MNTDTFGITKEVNYKIKMDEGWNYLKIMKIRRINVIK